ncbi:MAG: TonB-dependent receptor domain-containing protein, partial [Sphingopyxis sp.]
QLRPALPFSTSPQLSISNGLSTTQTQTESAAIFADGSARLSPTMRVLIGGRYSYDWVKASSFSIVDPAYPPLLGANGFTIPYTPRALDSGSTSKGDWSGRFGFEYAPNRDLMFFATIARGYLGPTVTFSGLTGTRTNVAPQTVRDITVGFKSQLFDRQVTLNANLFFDDYNNLQTSVFNGLEFLTENAGGFRANGFEMDAAWRVSPRFGLNGSFTYSDTQFTDYVTACPKVVKAGLTCYTANGTSLLQAAGEPLSGAPKYSATFGADFNHPVGDALVVDASTNIYYRSRVQYDVGNAISYQPGYYTIGATFGIGAQDRSWHVGVFARNLMDTRFHTAVIGLPFSDAGGEVNWLSLEGRRTVGVTADMRF